MVVCRRFGWCSACTNCGVDSSCAGDGDPVADLEPVFRLKSEGQSFGRTLDSHKLLSGFSAVANAACVGSDVKCGQHMSDYTRHEFQKRLNPLFDDALLLSKIVMDILWQPESGRCSHCGHSFKTVRRYTTDRYHVIFCFGCWKRAQKGKRELIVSRQEWLDDTAMNFECEIVGRHGTTQDVVWH